MAPAKSTDCGRWPIAQHTITVFNSELPNYLEDVVENYCGWCGNVTHGKDSECLG